MQVKGRQNATLVMHTTRKYTESEQEEPWHIWRHLQRCVCKTGLTNATRIPCESTAAMQLGVSVQRLFDFGSFFDDIFA